MHCLLWKSSRKLLEIWCLHSNSPAKMKPNFVALVIFLLAEVSVTFGLQCNLAQACTNGNLFKIIDSQNSIECLTNCKELEICGFYTFLSDSSTANCELFENCHETEPCSNCISGEVDCPNISCQLPGLCMVNLNFLALPWRGATS